MMELAGEPPALRLRPRNGVAKLVKCWASKVDRSGVSAERRGCETGGMMGKPSVA